MADKKKDPNLVSEEEIENQFSAGNWAPTNAEPIAPGQPTAGGAPIPSNNSGGQYGSGPLPPNFGYEPALVDTRYPASTGTIGLMPIQGGPGDNAKTIGVAKTIVEQAIAAIPAAVAVSTPSITDGLIHGQGGGGIDTGSWESDPAYVLMRDDFINLGTAANTAGNVTASIGAYNWAIIGNIDTGWQGAGGTPPNLGTIGWSNNTTASNAGCLILPSGGSPNAATGHTSGAWTLFEAASPPWKMTWIFQLNPIVSNGTVAFNSARKAIYIGLTGPHISTEIVTSPFTTRPDIFIGLRYDTSTTAPSINDSFFTLEVVCNSSGTVVARHNTQGTTFVTNVAPVAGVWHRLDISSSVAGKVTITLDGSTTNTLTATVPTVTITGGVGQMSGVIGNGVGDIAWTASTIPQGFAPFGVGTVITVSGFTGAQSPINGSWTLNNNDSGTNISWLSSATVANGSNGTVSITGLPAVYPVVIMGNDDTATPAFNMGISVDFFSFIWNPGLFGGTGTPVITNPRYFL